MPRAELLEQDDRMAATRKLPCGSRAHRPSTDHRNLKLLGTQHCLDPNTPRPQQSVHRPVEGQRAGSACRCKSWAYTDCNERSQNSLPTQPDTY